MRQPPYPIVVMHVCQCQVEAAHESWPEYNIWSCRYLGLDCACPCHCRTDGTLHDLGYQGAADHSLEHDPYRRH